MFVQYLVEQTHNVVKSERKPRRNIQYKDVANAVARIDNLEFLSDVVPRTQSYRDFKEKHAKKAAERAEKMAARPASRGGQGEVQMEDAQGQQRGLQQQQLPYGYQTNGQAMPPPPASPAIGVNGHSHARSHSGHSRSHSLEQQNIIHPQPPADVMQVDASPRSQRTYDACSSSPEMSRDPASHQLQMEARAVNGERPGTSSSRGFVMPNGDVV